MEQIVSMGDISQATIEDAVSQYVQFLQHVSAEDLNTHQDVDQSNPRKPSLLVDLVSSYFQRRSTDALSRIVRK